MTETMNKNTFFPVASDNNSSLLDGRVIFGGEVFRQRAAEAGCCFLTMLQKACLLGTKVYRPSIEVLNVF